MLFTKANKADLLPSSLRSREMEDAINRWQELALGQVPWRSSKRPRCLNLAAASTRLLSRLCCGELTLDCGDSPRGSWLSQSFERELRPQLSAALQQAMLGGAVAFRPFVEEDALRIEWLRADQFLPLERDAAGHIRRIAFLSRADWQGSHYLRWEEQGFEEKGYYIRQTVYLCGADGRAKKQVPLSRVPQWAALEKEVWVEGLQQPLWAIWQMPFANSVDGSSEPVSLLAAAEGIMEDIDKLYNDYCFEFSTARRKMILREDSLRLRRDGTPILPHSEAAEDVYLPLELPGDSQPFADYSPEIRESQYRQAMNQLLRLFELQCGLSSGTFSVEENSALTATQVLSQDRKTYSTIREVQEQGRDALLRLLQAMDAMASLYQLCPEGDWEPQLCFGDSVFEDTASEFERRVKMVELGMRPEFLISWYFGKSPEAAAKMLGGAADV